MPSSFTPSLRLTLPADGELVGTWGQTVNTGITESAGNLTTRDIRGLVVTHGDIQKFTQSGGIVVLTGGPAALSATAPVTFSTQYLQDVYFVDGTNYKRYLSSTDAVSTWVASAPGVLPVDCNVNTARLICTWRARIVLAGILCNPGDWFMSAVNNPLDWDYSPVSITPTQAVAGNNAPAGQIADIINTLIPYSDDVLIFGCDHTIWMLQGDPMSGGQIDLVTDTLGMAWGRPWCKGPDGTLYFFSSRGNVYQIPPAGGPEEKFIAGKPVRMSQQINNRLMNVNVRTSIIRMCWDERLQGLHVFITPLDGSATTNFFWESATNAWWPDVFGDPLYNPRSVAVFDGDNPDDRAVLLGCQDSYIRIIDFAATQDDRKEIDSFVVLGPLVTKNLDELILKDIVAVLSEGSGDVTYEVYVGQTAESALASAPVASGTWGSSRNFNVGIRRAGHAA